jgi:hypothetical protein
LRREQAKRARLGTAVPPAFAGVLARGYGPNAPSNQNAITRNNAAR